MGVSFDLKQHIYTHFYFKKNNWKNVPHKSKTILEKKI